MHQIEQVSLCSHLIHPVRLHLFKYWGGDKAHWISKNTMAVTAVQWESRTGSRTPVKMLRIYEVRVKIGTMTDLLCCCSSSTLGIRANDYVKTLVKLGFWLHNSSCSIGSWTNTLANRSLSPKCLPCTNSDNHWKAHIVYRRTGVIFFRKSLYIMYHIITTSV